MQQAPPFSPDRKARLHNALLTWFEQHRRPLPWRTDYAPYAVWISEIMLQQTQMERGVSYFQAWMERFPTIADLACAEEDEVLRAWEGLGYYSRARNILRAARTIQAEHAGLFPSAYWDIAALPGIGPYTAAAIASIAFNQDVACIDANVERVVSRLCDLDVPVRRQPGKALLAECADDLLCRGRARDYNQAVMELGALVCSRRPACPVCPLQSFCRALQHKTVHLRPVLPEKTASVALTIASGVLVSGGHLYIQKRLPNDVWGGLWEFPGGGVEQGECPEEAVVREFMEETGLAVRVTDKFGCIRHKYTKYNITLHCFALALADEASGPCPEPPHLCEASEFRWCTLEELKNHAMPSSHRKLAKTLSLSGDKLFSSLSGTPHAGERSLLGLLSG